MSKFKVTFYPDNKTVEVEKERTILAAALSAGISLNANCGGDGVCGRCKVIVRKGNVTTLPTGKISLEEQKKNIYLACLTAIQGDCQIDIPLESKLDLEKLSGHEVDRRLKGFYAHAEEIDPVGEKAFAGSKLTALTQKVYVELPVPDFDDRLSDWERLCRQIQKDKGYILNHTSLVNVRFLGELLRSADWKVTVTIARRKQSLEVLEVQAGDTSRKNYGLAFDIGTTTVSGQLVELVSGKVLGTKATYNRQASFGADVITRIIYAQKQQGLEKLHYAVTESMNTIISELAREHKVDINDLTCVLCAGNPTMMHLLLRVDPTYIRREPYVPTLNFVPVIRAFEAGIKINPKGLLYCVPGVSSYVGGDVTAGVLSCALDKREDLAVLIDIGTNGEIVLGNKDFLMATSASAGPAFEGSGMGCGMRSGMGAIQKVSIDPKSYEVTYETIGKAAARGICGSGYIDLLAQLLKAKILNKDGKFQDMQNKRIRHSELGREFIVVFKEDSDTHKDIVISETDIDNIKRAKAAIYAATYILAKKLELDFNSVTKIFVAGGFGTSLDIESAVSIGLLPDVARDKYEFVGNSALYGAKQMLLSDEGRINADDIARKMTYLELSVEPGYMDEYMAALFFPHTDLNRFATQ